MKRACNMLAKNRINRNKTDNRAKIDIKNLDFITFIQNSINRDISRWNKHFIMRFLKASSILFY